MSDQRIYLVCKVCHKNALKLTSVYHDSPPAIDKVTDGDRVAKFFEEHMASCYNCHMPHNWFEGADRNDPGFAVECE